MELDLNYHPPKGVSFDCAKCPKNIQKVRRCREDRWDFTEKDDPSVFPMYVSKGSSLFSFCPGKATWSHETVSLYQSLKLSSESGSMWISGGIADQPYWWVDLLAWFLPRYNDLRFSGRIRSFLGDDPGKMIGSLLGKGQANGNRQR